MADLVVREAQLGEAGCSVGLVSFAVGGLLDGVEVGAEAVCLDDEAEGGKPEVDPVAVDVVLGEWGRQACGAWRSP